MSRLSVATTFQVCLLVVGLSRVSPATVGSREKVEICLQRCDVVTSGSGGWVQTSLCFQPHDAVCLRLVSDTEDYKEGGKRAIRRIGLNLLVTFGVETFSCSAST